MDRLEHTSLSSPSIASSRDTAENTSPNSSFNFDLRGISENIPSIALYGPLRKNGRCLASKEEYT
jgi:hypothetical protein